MPSLGLKEKQAGKLFRAQCLADLQALDAPENVSFCPPYVVWYRHECRRRGTWALFLREHRWTSPEYWVCYCGVVGQLGLGGFPHDDCDGGVVIAPEGMFAFIWREGRCDRCNKVVRSGTGRFCLAEGNPPDKGAVVESSHGSVRSTEANHAGAS